MTPRPLHVILATVGTDGDVFPHLSLGATLRRRGHKVTLCSIDRYRNLAAQADLCFESLMTNEQADRLIGHPDFWHPIKGPPVAARLGIGLLSDQYATLERLARGLGSVIVANPAVLAARLLQERRGVPMATLALQPWLLPSVTAPPHLPLIRLRPWMTGPVIRLCYRGIDVIGDILIGKHLNRFRRSIELRPIQRLFQWWFSPTRMIGLFPDWFGLPQADWPPQLRMAGFGIDDARLTESATVALEPRQWEAFCASGSPPIAFTAGTGMRHAGAFFRAAIEACVLTGHCGVLVSRFADQIPASLPANIFAVPFAPFAELLPRCAAIVHHGGIGTVAAALAAGIPQLVIPSAYDQPDNAERICRLGVGETLPAKRVTAFRLAAKLKQIFTAEKLAAARRFQTLCDGKGFDRAAEMVQAMAVGSTEAIEQRKSRRE